MPVTCVGCMGGGVKVFRRQQIVCWGPITRAERSGLMRDAQK